MSITKQDIYRAIDLAKEYHFDEYSHFQIYHEQGDLSYFMNGGMKGYLKMGQKRELNFYGVMVYLLFVDLHDEVPFVDRERLHELFIEAKEDGVSELNIDEPILMTFLYDGFYASPYLTPDSIPTVFCSIAAIVKSFQEATS